MDTQTENLASLAVLLHAERLALPLSPEALAERFARSRRFQPLRSDAYAALSLASRIAPPEADRYRDSMAIAGLIRHATLTTTASPGPVLLVCESRPFEPDMANLHDQVLLRLLAGLASLGAAGWILRTPRSRLQPLKWLLASLPERPAAIVSVGLSDPQCLETLTSLAPVVRLGTRSISTSQIPCVEYDTRLEAAAITACAAAHGAEQIAFIASLVKPAGRRRVGTEDVAVLSALTVEAQNRHIAVPPSLTWWLDSRQSLQAAGLLPKLIKHAQFRMLLVISGTSPATEAASALANLENARIICRHWSPAGAPAVPVIGPNLDRLALVALIRLLNHTNLPAEAALLVPPAWHQGP